MRIFKFGGASLRSAAGVRNVASIIQAEPNSGLLVVVSAMGKVTDMLERLCFLARTGQDWGPAMRSAKKFHTDIIDQLFKEPTSVLEAVNNIIEFIEREVTKEDDQDQVYDQVVSQGEMLSSLIVHHYLKINHANSCWIDAREYIRTDNTFREGKVDWTRTAEQITTLKSTLLKQVVITQGFLGKGSNGLTTTLGREGSDFTAAIFASSLQAESVTIWKDVTGVMNADPRKHLMPIIFDELPFKEAAEMTYYGASVIHPKTIRPLAIKGIPLFVKNFDDPTLPGTKIHECVVNDLPPLIVWKENQCLISCKVTDYTFISEHQLHDIFSVLLELDIQINVMQNSAITFSFCIDFRPGKVSKLIARLQKNFEVYYNTGLTLITVKNYDQATSEKYRKMPGLLLEQSSRSTIQILVRPT